jgi:hypothetical protein
MGGRRLSPGDVELAASRGLVVDRLALPTMTLPTAVKRRFRDLITLTGSRLVDTATLSTSAALRPCRTWVATERSSAFDTATRYLTRPLPLRSAGC